jgi:hypothetical protein
MSARAKGGRERKGTGASAAAAAALKPSRGPTLSGTAWAAILYALVVVIVFNAVVLGGQTFVSSDTTAPLGFVRVGEESLWKHGTYPLWNPYVFLGMPSYSSGAYNPLIYPPDWPVAVVQKVLPFLPGVSWMLLYYFLAGLGTFLLARSWGASTAGAIVAGIGFMITPNFVANGAHGHGSQVVNEAYLPWLLWITSRVWRHAKLTDAALLALLIGFQLLRGHVQIAYYGWLAIGILSLFELARTLGKPGGARDAAMRLGLVGAALGLGFALSSFFSLPIREYAEQSIRSAGTGGGLKYDYATSWSFSPVEMLTFLVPGALGFGSPTYWGTMPFTDYPNYMGLAFLAVAFLAVVAGRRPFHVTFLLVLAAFCLLVSFGKHGGIYDFLFKHLPYFNKFRVPVMILIVFQLAIAVLAGLGLTAVAEAAADETRRKRMVLWTGVLAAGVAVLWITGLLGDVWHSAYAQAARASRPDPRLLPDAAIETGYAAMSADIVRVGFIALVSLAALIAGMLRRFPVRWAIAGVAVATLVDLYVVDKRLMAPVLGPPRQLTAAAERDEVIDFLLSKKAEGEFRIFPSTDFQSNRYAGFRIASLGGYHAAKTQLYQEFLDADSGRAVLSPIAWRLLNVRYLVVNGLLPPEYGFTEAFRGQSELVYEFPPALPRVTLVPAFRVVPHAQQLALYTDRTHDPASVTLLEKDPGIVPTAHGRARVAEYGLNRVLVETDAEGPTILRLADLDFPGWRVTIDGKPGEILRADYMLRAVALPAGPHRVEFVFHDLAFEKGLGISLAALAVILGAFGYGVWRERRRTPPAPAAAA